MPKLQSTSNIAINIPLSNIVETGNVRKDYATKEIAELAESIQLNGLINPITVRRMEEQPDGSTRYELIAGHRRIRAYRYLIEHGQNYTYIPACVHTGDKHRLQLIENIQRENLSPEELEAGLKTMRDAGLSSTDIAKQLGKTVQWVSDITAGIAVRERIETVAPAAKVDDVSTLTLAQLRSVPDEKLPEALEQMQENGNTYRAAAAAAKSVKQPVRAQNQAAIERKPAPLMISIQTVIETIEDYQRRQRSKYFDQNRSAEEHAVLETCCIDLKTMFEAYQHN